MCGIAGAVSADPRSDVEPLVARLTRALAHRGPDGSGARAVRGRSIVLGHRRLSIVDLECGAQPMANEDGRVWVVMNGELYNHLDLRPELERLGHHFRTHADTEVLVHGWEEWGAGVLERLNGMYALALWDGRTEPGALWLARDPVGVKPVYLGCTNHTWWFASELAAACACGLVSDDLRPEAIDEFLVFRFIPSPGTPFHNAWKVPPGHLCRVPLDGSSAAPRFEAFTTRFAPAVLPQSSAEWAEAIRAGISASVRRQLMSDVPVGSLLSGGVDSTLITSVMRDALPEPPAAFAIGFRDRPELDELGEARRAASALGVPLHEVSVFDTDYVDAWPAEAAALGEPIANSSALLMGLLCRRVRQTHKVVLTGQGADEPLGGYPRHTAERFRGLARAARPVLDWLPDRMLSSDRIARLRRIAGARSEAERFTETLAVFSAADAIAMTRHPLDPGALVEPVRRWLRSGDGEDSLNRLLYVDARLSLADDLLIVADHMSMASSVELRVPFLDLEFLALVERMPGRLKVSLLGERKWFYRDAVSRMLPQGVRGDLTGWGAKVGRKLGFSTPIDSWFPRWLETDAEQFLTGRSARIPDTLDAVGVRKLIDDVRYRGAPRTRQLMSLFVLENWLRGRGVKENVSTVTS